MRLAGRGAAQLFRALRDPVHYRALIAMRQNYPDFRGSLARYLLGRGSYPCHWRVRTPQGEISPRLWSYDDFLTLNEIFCREDYQTPVAPSVVVDIGSNIGLSALYFLTRSETSYCFLYEPVPQNIERLRVNLSDFETRYTVDECAVTTRDGTYDFATEPTGRYGKIGGAGGTHISVRGRSLTAVLDEVLASTPFIDVLKLDVEDSEVVLAQSLQPRHLRRIRWLIYEDPRATWTPPGWYQHSRSCNVHRLTASTSPFAGNATA